MTRAINNAQRIYNPQQGDNDAETLGRALAELGLDWVSAARLVLELAESDVRKRSGRALMHYGHRVIRMGVEALHRPTCAGCRFEEAVVSFLAEHADRRPRTRAELAGVCRRLLREYPGLPARLMGDFSPQDCESLLGSVFPTPRQRCKGRTILHALFRHARRRGWCAANPVEALPRPFLPEQELAPLSPEEVQRLLHAARGSAHRPCMPALGLMLWGGIRPAEVERLAWSDIDREEGVIRIAARHCKTGGCRHVTLFPVLSAWLQESGWQQSGSICPRDWVRRWRRLRAAAGLLPWRQDVLRHTFASYHAKMFRDFAALQMEMGHHSAVLLRTRYLSMEGITAAAAQRFWKPGAW